MTHAPLRVVVTGASGMLGSDLAAAWREGGDDVLALGRSELDVTDLAAVRRALTAARAHVVVHAAAHTDVDGAERDPDLAHRINAIGSANVALGCMDAASDLVHVSSCGVFDGRKAAPYVETDRPAPLTRHHESKLAGEEAVRRLWPRHYVLRPGWLFGGAPSHRKNFVAARWREAKGKRTLESAGDRFGSPTYTLDFALAARRLVAARAYGLYHVANAGVASRADYVRGCLAALGLDVAVREVASSHFPRAAPVPAWEALDSRDLRLRGFPALRPWGEALGEYVRERLAGHLEPSP